MGQGGEEQQVTPKIVPFSVSVLAVVTNKVETATCTLLYRRLLIWYCSIPDKGVSPNDKQKCMRVLDYQTTSYNAHTL